MKYLIYSIMIILIIACNSNGNKFKRNLDKIESLFNYSELEIKTSNDLIIGEKKGLIKQDWDTNYYFVDFSSQLIKINKNGELSKVLKNIGQGPGEYQNISDFAIDNNKNIYIATHLSNKLIKYDADFNYIKEIRINSKFPSKRIVIVKKLLYLYDYSNSKDELISIYDLNLNYVKSFGLADEIGTKLNPTFLNGDIKYLNNKLFVTRGNYPQIDVYDLDGKKLNTIELKINFEKISERIHYKINMTSLKFDLIKSICCFNKFLIINVLSINSKDKVKNTKNISYIMDYDGNVLKKYINNNQLFFYLQASENSISEFEFYKENEEIKQKKVKLTLKKEYE